MRPQYSYCIFIKNYWVSVCCVLINAPYSLSCVVTDFYLCLSVPLLTYLVQINLSSAFYRVNHQRILFKLCFWELVGCCVMYFLTIFLSNQSQYVMLDGCMSKLVNVVSRVHQGIILGLELFFLYTVEAFSIVKSNLYAFADDFTLVAVVPSPGNRVTVTDSLNCNLIRVSMWCDL